MSKALFRIILIVLVACHGSGGESHAAPDDGVHLFLLSGQSNMAQMDPTKVFSPEVEKLLGSKNVVVIKVAQKSQPIRRWFKKWVVAGDQNPKQIGDLYDELMDESRKALGGRAIKTATFIWMQGERDAKEKLSKFYEESLLGVMDQIKSDLQIDQLNYIIGRLSDNGIGKSEWDTIRDIQVKIAESNPNGAWVDTDDLNHGKDLHYTPEGYDELARRYAAKIKLLLNQYLLVK